MLVILLGLTILCLCCLPFLHLNRDKARRALCNVQMRNITLGYMLWVQENGNKTLPFRVPFQDGGLKDPGTNQIQIPGIGAFDPTLRSNAWLQFLFISFELNMPKELLCPFDAANNTDRKRAISWDKKTGLASPGMQNNCISYCINLDAGTSPGGGSMDLASPSNQVLLTERHMEYDTINSACSADMGLTKVVKVNRPRDVMPQVKWKQKEPKLHGKDGNAALLDGSVHAVNSQQLQERLKQPSDNGELHFIYP